MINDILFIQEMLNRANITFVQKVASEVLLEPKCQTMLIVDPEMNSPAGYDPYFGFDGAGRLIEVGVII